MKVEKAIQTLLSLQKHSHLSGGFCNSALKPSKMQAMALFCSKLRLGEKFGNHSLLVRKSEEESGFTQLSDGSASNDSPYKTQPVD